MYNILKIILGDSNGKNYLIHIFVRFSIRKLKRGCLFCTLVYLGSIGSDVSG